MQRILPNQLIQLLLTLCATVSSGALIKQASPSSINSSSSTALAQPRRPEDRRVAASLATGDEACFHYKFPPGVPDPCQHYVCPNQAWCVPSEDLRRPSCVCYNECFDVGSSVDNRAVCGTNGRDYASLCDLRREACSLRTDLVVKYLGKCGRSPLPSAALLIAMLLSIVGS